MHAEKLVAVVLCTALAGCATRTGEYPFDLQPVETVTVAGASQGLANCTYARLDKLIGVGVLKTDNRIVLESNGLRYWALTFAPAAPGHTSVAFSRLRHPPAFGTFGNEDVMVEARSCAGTR